MVVVIRNNPDTTGSVSHEKVAVVGRHIAIDANHIKTEIRRLTQ